MSVKTGFQGCGHSSSDRISYGGNREHRGIIVLALAVLFLIILYVIAELWKKPETLDEYEDLQGDRRYLKTQKELKMEEKARERRMQEEDRELLYGEKDRRKRAKKEEKERRKKIRTGGFVDEIYEDDLEEDAR